MGFHRLPVEVQVIAAQLLRERIERNDEKLEKEPVKQLAQEVREAFTELHSPSESFSSQSGSD